MIAIVDYGVGNLYSLKSSFAYLGIPTVVTRDQKEIENSDKIILPGVGAFRDAAESLRGYGLDTVMRQEAAKGKPIMGICLGMQMLFEKSYEYGEYDGLGLLSGSVTPLLGAIPEELKIPHIGWNALHFPKDKEKSPLLRYVEEGDCVYFVHSYHATDCSDSVIATAEYGIDVTAAVGKGNIFGCQFHPEKSGEVGMKILRAFHEYKG